MVKPRRGSQDNSPWRELKLNDITDQTIESVHIYDVYLGETVVPYATLKPLKAVLPLRRGDTKIAADSSAEGGVSSLGLDTLMRRRWGIVNRLWEANKAAANKLSLLDRLDFRRELSAQFKWQQDNGDKSIRVVHTGYGEPTAALLLDATAVVDHKLYWMPAVDVAEANYLLAIINSQSLAESVNTLTTPNWSGKTRDLHKHLWKLPIPEYDEGFPLHRNLAQAGEAAAAGVQLELAKLREQHGDKLTVTIARREIRKWLRSSKEGAAVERLVGELLGGG